MGSLAISGSTQLGNMAGLPIRQTIGTALSKAATHARNKVSKVTNYAAWLKPSLPDTIPLSNTSELLSLPIYTQRLLRLCQHITNAQMLLCFVIDESAQVNLVLPSHLPGTAYDNIISGVTKGINTSETWTVFILAGSVYLSQSKSHPLSPQVLYRFSLDLLQEFISHTESTTGEPSGWMRAPSWLRRFERLDTE